MDNQLSFGIHNMKSRVPSAVYFILHLFDGFDTDETEANELFVETKNPSDPSMVHREPVYIMKNRWVVDNTYSTYHDTFTIDESFVDKGVVFQIEIRTDNISSENPLYFNKLMFNEGEWEDDHHIPNEVTRDVKIGFNKSSYANLYNDDTDTYLQVIRPMRDAITTNELTKSSCTVLAPHIASEQSTDDPINLFLEFINQTEQRIDVLR